MPKPEVVVFDLGKVLVDFDYSIIAGRLKSRASVPLEDVATRLDQSPLLVAYETGRITTPEFFTEVQKLTGYQGTLEEFAVEFGDIFSPIDEMIALQGRLREQGIPTYIFSNTNELAVRHITSAYPFFSGFNGYVYSHEVGHLKPDAPIYEAVEGMTGKSGDAIVYLDDRAENIAAGAARGWQAILHETPAKTLARIAGLGL